MGYYQFKEEDAFSFAQHVGIRARKRDRELWFQKCPYCGNNSKDKEKFSINLDTGKYNCFRASCGAKGNMIDLSKDFDFSLGTDIDAYYKPKMTFRKFKKDQVPETREPAVVYLGKRGISEEVVKRYRITTQKEHENILVFPFLDQDGNMVTVKYRKTDFDKNRDKAKEWFETGCKPILFGMNQCDMSCSDLVLTEGQIDSLSLTEAGIANAISVPNGANGFTWIPHCWDWVQNFRTITVFGDFENGKMSLLETIKERFGGRQTIKFVQEENYKGCKDANDILLKYGKQALVDAVREAKPVPNPRIIDMSEIQIENAEDKEHFSTGFGWLNRMIGGFYFGQLVILTGKRGEGKSTLASQFFMNAIKAGYAGFAYSGELDKENFKEWFSRQIAGGNHINSFEKNGKKLYSINQEDQQKINQWLRGKAYLFSNEIWDGDKTEEEVVVETIENAIGQYGCRVILIDNLMTAISSDSQSEVYNHQTRFCRKLKLIAQRSNVLVMLIAHPRKTSDNPDNDDVAGSANITNLADTVICYTRPTGKENRDSPTRVLTVSKNRLNGRTDTVGINLYFQESSKRISVNNFFDDVIGWEDETVSEDESEGTIAFD